MATGPQLDTRSPYQIAMEKLEQIDALNLPTQRRFKEHYTLVSDCVRGYLEGEYRVFALERTTDELRSNLRSTILSTGQTKRVLDLLQESDLVKFTKLSPDVESAQQMTHMARVLIDEIRPTQMSHVWDDADQVAPARTR